MKMLMFARRELNNALCNLTGYTIFRPARFLLCVTVTLLLCSSCFSALTLAKGEEEEGGIDDPNVISYPWPQGMDEFSGVSMRGNGERIRLYSVRANNTHSWTEAAQSRCNQAPVAMFDMAGTVAVEIAVPLDVSSVIVRPLSSNISAKAEGKKITFTISKPGCYSVEYNNNLINAVMIFANPVEQFTGSTVLEAGIYEQDFTVTSGQTLYLKPGAVIRGSVELKSNSSIVGRGIIDGSIYQDWILIGHKATLPIKMYNTNNVKINGIAILDPNAWTIEIRDTSNVNINNLKIISSRCNSDGISIQSSNNVNITNSFLRTWDDGIVVKNYTDNDSYAISAKNCVLWTDLAQSMEIGVETNKGVDGKRNVEPKIYDVSFEDLTILHALHKAPISIHNGDNAEISDITFKNIIVEDYQSGSGDGWNYLIDITNLTGAGMGGASSWTTVKERGSIHDVLVDTVTILAGKTPGARFDSREGGTIYDVTVKNVTRASAPLDFSANVGKNCRVIFE